MSNLETIEILTDEILSDEIDFYSLKKKLGDFKSMLLKLTNLDLSTLKGKEDLHFENGKALSTNFAALCTDDIMRTRQFIRGIFEAVKSVITKNDHPIKILYVGTGPFATLILPLISKYKSKEIQFTLFEVNKRTTQYLMQVIKFLKIEDYIDEIICEDASKYTFKVNPNFDIIISETMQTGLEKEQQVPIMLNLIEQLNEDIIMIPSKIRLDLALMNSDTALTIQNKDVLKFKMIRTLLEFDKDFILSYIKHIKPSDQPERIELCKQCPFIPEQDEDFDRLTVLTIIQVYGKEWLKVDSSSLTVPKLILHLSNIKDGQNEISIDYVIKSLPDFEYELN